MKYLLIFTLAFGSGCIADFNLIEPEKPSLQRWVETYNVDLIDSLVVYHLHKDMKLVSIIRFKGLDKKEIEVETYYDRRK